jgi:hypothetical protein
MATIADGTTPGRSSQPARQSPARHRQGRGETGDDTMESVQTPSDIFGFAQTYSTGARGSAGGGSVPADVTLQKGQLDAGLAQVSGSEITSTGAPGSQGTTNRGGGEAVTYTDLFGVIGGVNRSVTTTGVVSGSGDWTQFNSDGYDSGPTLPALQNARPTSSGAGQGHVRGAGRGL